MALIPQRLIRNFCIIAHIDHGKSTLADRLLEFTGSISKRDMQDQVLDTMDLERERGITIKLQAVRMTYPAEDGKTYELNLIDTPGHVDFAYEVSRSLAACEEPSWSSTQRRESRPRRLPTSTRRWRRASPSCLWSTRSTSTRPSRSSSPKEIAEVTGIPRERMILASAKQGLGTREILEAVVSSVPPPRGVVDAPLRGLVFDSHYDTYRGVIVYIRVVDGTIKPGMRVRR